MDEKKLNKEIERILRAVNQLMYKSYLAGLNIPQVKNSLSGDRPFWFSGNASANKAMDRIVADLAKRTESVFVSGIDRAWNGGKDSIADKMKLTFSANARQQKAYDTIRAEATQQQRNQGARGTAERFAGEKRGGITLSDRVWKLGDGAKREIETIIQNGMKEGKGADELARMLKKHLNNPDASFRRVRNKETGELELSDAARKYKPGRGVYRSAAKNAERLARTEIKSAYVRAKWDAIQNDPTVIGIRIKLSNNHTCINPKTGKPEPFKDICDELAGVYPKTFMWTGWHPNCRCDFEVITAPVLEQRKILDAKAAGKEYTPKQITEPPEALGEWIEQNKERAKGWENMPYWAKDNGQFIPDDFKANTYSKPEYTFTRARNVQMAMNRAVKELTDIYPEIENTELAAIHHYTQNGGNYRQLNRQLEKGALTDFNRAASTLISKGLAQLPTVTGTVYRGTIIKRVDYERLYSGDSVTHNIFTSASKNFDPAMHFATYRGNIRESEVQIMLTIHSKTGRDVSRISEFNGKFVDKNQHEVLFDKNSEFEIIKHETDRGGTVWIEMKEL